MSGEFRFETFVDTHSNIFNEYLSSNSGDACRQNSYSIGSSVIYGYGIPAY